MTVTRTASHHSPCASRAFGPHKLRGSCLALLTLLIQNAALAANPSPQPLAGGSAPKTAVVAGGPQWTELSPAQQQALKPLASKWNTLSELQRRKWIALAQNYPNMSPAEQAKLQSRMTEWASLSMQQRDQARVNFAQAKSVPPDERQEKWRKYQELSPAERAALANKAKATPKGAAPAIKPAASQQLTVVAKKPRASASAGKAGVGASGAPVVQPPAPAASVIAQPVAAPAAAASSAP